MTLDEQQQQIDQLEKTVAALNRKVKRLLQSEERRSQPSMRTEVRCPACGVRRLIHASSVLDRDAGGRGEMALVQPSSWFTKGLGKIEAYVCVGCGLMEYWVKDVHYVAKRVAEGKIDALRIIDATDSDQDAGPYR